MINKLPEHFKHVQQAVALLKTAEITALQATESYFRQTDDFAALAAHDRQQIAQLALLDAMTTDNTPADQQITPEAIGQLMGDFVRRIIGDAAKTLCDVAAGSSNLLWVVMNQLQNRLTAFGTDSDAAQVTLGQAVARFIGRKDTETLTILAPEADCAADIVIADSPLDFAATRAILARAVQTVREDGWLCVVVSADVVTTSAGVALLREFSDRLMLQACLSFPEKFFASKEHAKVMLALRPKTCTVQRDVLMGTYPSPKNRAAFEEFLQDIDHWVKLDSSN